MTASSVLLILVGLFVIINAPNFVGVIKGEKQFNLTDVRHSGGGTW